MIVNRAWHAKPVNNQISWQTRDFGRERNWYGFYNSVSVVWDFAYFYILAKIYLLNDLTRVDPLPGDEKKSTLLEGLPTQTVKETPPPPRPRPQGNSTTRVN